MPSLPVAAAIVAGGRARRFGGRDKCRLPVGGRSIIARQLDVLRRVTSALFIVADDASRFDDLDLPIHADVLPGHGSLGGLYTALVVSPAELTIVVGCDQPFLDARLLVELTRRVGDADAAWVETSRGPQPFLACYRAAAAAAIREVLDAGRLRATDLGRVLDVHTLDGVELARFGDADRLLANVNTPEEYERIQYLSE